jgi:cytochrome c oxidase subunit I+III
MSGSGFETVAIARPDSQLRDKLTAIWSRPPGLLGFMSDVNHGSLGLRFMATAAIYFAIGGLLAMLIRVQLANPRSAFVGPEVYNQIFTMHGTVMMFLFAIPMLEGLAIFLLPKMLGARDLAFPRLTALGWYCFFFGGLILLGALLAGAAPDSGWFMYPPLSDRIHTPGINADVWLLGVTFVEISAVCAAVEIIVSILKVRASGMGLMQMPLFAWYILGTAAMMLIGFPPLIAGSILLEVQRAFDWPFFDPARGGDPMLWQHLFWLFGHPEVYIIFLPAAGALSTMIPTFARTPIISYKMILVAVASMVVLSMGLWVHHMFATGIPHLALAFFAGASMMVAIPTAIQIFVWIGTLWAGRPRWSVPMLYIAGFFLTFVFGGLTGVMLAAVPFNWQAHDTAFVTAHLHYVLIGGFVFPLLAATAYWAPLVTGRRGVPGIGVAAFWLIFLGTHGTFLVMHLTGMLGMPRRISVYPDNPEWELLNLISSIGGFVAATGFALFAADLGYQAYLGRKSRHNPWRAGTLEWALKHPAPTYNFAALPVVAKNARIDHQPPRVIDSLCNELEQGRGLLGDASRLQRETLTVTAVNGAAESVVALPGNTLRPFYTALAIGSFFALMLAQLYWFTPLAIALIAYALVTWAGTDGEGKPSGMIPIGDGRELPPNARLASSLGWWGSATLLIANGALFASLYFGAVFLAVVAPNWPANDLIGRESGDDILLLGGGMAVLVSSAAIAAAGWFDRLWRGNRTAAGLGAIVLTSALMLAGTMAHWWSMGGLPVMHALYASQAALLFYVAAHFAISALIAVAIRRAADEGQVTDASIAVLRQWLVYTGACGVFVALALIVERL